MNASKSACQSDSSSDPSAKAYGIKSLMGDSWALPSTRTGPASEQTVYTKECALDRAGIPYPDDTKRGLDSTSVTGTSGAFDPYTGAYGTAGTPMTCGYGKSGSTIGIGYTAGRRAWEEMRYRGATPGAYAYEHGGNPAPATRANRPAPVPAPAAAAEPARPFSLFGWLLGEVGAGA